MLQLVTCALFPLVLSFWLLRMAPTNGQMVDQTETVVFKGQNASLPCTVAPSNAQFVLEWVRNGHGPIYTLLNPQGEHHRAFGYDSKSFDCPLRLAHF
uniref:Ig-like domain-containing protein n=1 Tax=Trichuris muris TaxID=70415 RepID=A0A5S6QI98_TRIMR